MVVPSITDIVPIRIESLNQTDLLLPPPPLDLLLAIDCCAHIVEALPINQPAGAKFIREPLEDFFFVLPCTLVQVAGDTGVEHARSAGQNVNVIDVFAHFEA